MNLHRLTLMTKELEWSKEILAQNDLQPRSMRPILELLLKDLDEASRFLKEEELYRNQGRAQMCALLLEAMASARKSL